VWLLDNFILCGVAVGGFHCLLDARGLASLLALIKEPLVRQGKKRVEVCNTATREPGDSPMGKQKGYLY
jgi:hypothetical protein